MCVLVTAEYFNQVAELGLPCKSNEDVFTIKREEKMEKTKDKHDTKSQVSYACLPPTY